MRNYKNIVFFVTTLDSGGLENYLLRFLQYKSTDFNKVTVFCKGGKGGQLEKQFLSIPNVAVRKCELSYLNINDYMNLAQFFRNNKIDTVCDFTGNFSGLVMLVAKVVGIVKRVSFYRGSTNHFQQTLFKTLYNTFVRQLTYLFATDILSNSKAAFDFFYPRIWKNEKRFKVINNGINSVDMISQKNNLRSEFNIPEDAFVVGHTGRYNSAKNHATILKVAVQLCEKYSDIYFVLCGNHVKDNLLDKVKKENLLDRIILQNNRTDIPAVLNTFNCYYFPSVTEGQPNALIEAMIMNVPIIASDIPPIKECVPNYYHHQLVPPLSYEQAADKILNIYNNGSEYSLQKWAVDYYDYRRLFNDFFYVLNNRTV